MNEKPEVPVLQERIRRLLTTIAEAEFFARKSNKPENLAQFNLSPLKSKNSRVIEVELKAGDDVVQNFELGDINVDLGRGAKAAYIKFENQFQVWEIIADFVNMDLKWQNWTYANLWDLRYGRLSEVENIKSPENMIYLLKYLLNTSLESVSDEPFFANAKPLITSRFVVENGNYATFNLYKQNDEAYVRFEFDAENQNPHLRLASMYLNNKYLKINPKKAEKIIEQFK